MYQLHLVANKECISDREVLKRLNAEKIDCVRQLQNISAQ